MTAAGDSTMLRVGVIGAGWAGGQHLDGWSRVANAEIVAVQDASAATAAARADEFAIRRHTTDTGDILDDPEINVVSVCTPARFHAPLAIAALKLGKHVLVEKPLARTLEEARAVVAAEKVSTGRLAVGHNYRFQSSYGPFVEAIREGAIGRPAMITVRIFLEVREKPAMHDADGNRGPVLDQGVHFYDLWRYAFRSNPIRVMATGFALGPQQPELAGVVTNFAIDTATVAATFESGDVGVMNITWSLPRGTQFSDPFGDVAVGPAGLIATGSGQRVALWNGSGQQTIADRAPIDSIAAHIDDVATRLTRGEAPTVGASDGLWAVATAEAALRSIETGTAAPVVV